MAHTLIVTDKRPLDPMKFLTRSSFLMVALSACGGGRNPDLEAAGKISPAQNVKGTKFEILSEDDFLEFGSGELSGKGSVRFAENLGEANSGHNFVLRFLLKEASSFKFVGYADKNLSQGVEVNFSRSAASTRLQVVTSANNTSADWSEFFKTIDATAEIAISLDIHNDEGAFAHLMFWNNANGALLLNSGEDVDGAPGKGNGIHWGLVLNGATVKETQKGEPKFKD